MAQNFQPNFNPLFRPSVIQTEQQPMQQHLQSVMATMPPPTSLPWTIENMPWAQQRIPSSQSHLMQFEAHASMPTMIELDSRRALYAKRKLEIPSSTPPAKQFISEEKISAHFNGLHISNNAMQNTNSTCLEDAVMSTPSSTSCVDYRVKTKELEEKLKNANRITLCEDVLKMHKEQNKMSLLPDALINRIEKPCMALVLWQPPPILELLHRKKEEEVDNATAEGARNPNHSNQKTCATIENQIDDIEFLDADAFDDAIDNNNTYNLDYNDVSIMDEDS